MDPEIKKALDDIRASLGKNVELAARLDQIEAAAVKREESTKTLREQLDAVVRAQEAREKKIDDLQREMRVQRSAGPQVDRQTAIAMLGMIGREILCRRIGTEVPSVFRGEAELIRGFQEAQRATLSSLTTTGTYLIPTVTESQLIDTLEEVSELLGLVDFIPGLPAASTIYIPTLTGRATLKPARATTDTAPTQSDPTFGQLELTPKEAYIYFPVDNRLIQMSAVALGARLLSILQDSLAVGIADWLLNGDGTSTYNSITGILKDTTSAYNVSLPAGKKAFSDLAKSDLTATIANNLKRGRGPNARWVCSLDIQGLIEDLDRTGKVPVITFAQDGTPRCLQRPIVIEEGMPDIADSSANTVMLGFGDLATFIVGMIGGVMVATSDQYKFGENQTCFRGVLNMAIARKPVKTFTTLRTAV